MKRTLRISAGRAGAGPGRAFAAQAPQHQNAARKHGNVEGAQADEQDQLLVGRAQVAAGGKRHGRATPQAAAANVTAQLR